MQRDLSREELCQRIVEHLIPAMRYSEIAVPLIELDGRRFTARKVSEGLRHSIQADVHLGDETRGRVSVYYAEERPFLIPEEQDLLDSIAEALGRWLERKQVQEEIREQLRYNEALLEIDRAISSTLELDQVLDLVLEQLGEVLPYESASLFLLSDGSVELVAARGHPHPDRATEVAFSVEDDALTRAVLNREHPLILDDAQADDRFQARGEASYVRSWIGVPLTTKGTRIGIMTIDHHEAGFYDDASAAKVEAFARQAAVAIDNARLFEQAQREIVQRRVAEQALERQLRRVSLLNEIAHAMAARQDLDSIFRVVVQKLEDRFADVVSIWLREGDAFTLASAGDQIWQAVRESSLPAEVSLPSEAAADFVQGELRHAADLTRLDLPLPQRVAQELTIRSAVTAPLVAEGEILGALVSGRHERGAFSDKELDFLKGLSRHVALAIHQAQLHDNLQAAYDDLRETQQAMMRQERLGALGEMASGIAHDINNAISPIPLYTQLIRRAMDLDEQAMRHLRTIERAVEDVEETVGRMRQFYRKREEREFTPLALNKAARQAIQLTRPRWRDMPQERGITIDLETDFAEDLPPVMGNEAEIRQAVTNLILNAVDAMPDGGVLSVRTGMAVGAPPRVVLKVSDTGVGMDEETQRRCFEPFFSTKGERGSGMGLATVYGTMQRHDGDVEVESAPGEGTTMRLLFPVREVTGRDEVREGVAPPSPLRILCVDDESRVRQALQEALEGKGHAVELADGGESGLAAFRAARRKGQPFDVVITDLGMPYVDGREVARSVKREAPETPVILLTGWGKRLSAQNDVPEAVDLLLSKPASIETLNRALARVVTKGGPTSSQ
jgi:signal transduction histidine kinase/ActR/RegA family two-component response regulator/putative methionine-R-sulfoxide reductase with GAF domain